LLRRFAPRNDGIAIAVIQRSRALARRLEGWPQALATDPSRLAAMRQVRKYLRMTVRAWPQGAFVVPFASENEAIMSTLTVTAKGQVTLPKNLLKHLGVRPGEKIAVAKLPGGRIEMRAARPTGKISDVFGLLKKKDGPSLSIEDINRIAAKGWAGKR
jgi:AbrB family looped-hinge helix DNA binding protein